MAEIWADVLQLQRVGTTDSIYELGADSLTIFRIAARAQREGLPLKAAQIFEYHTIDALCKAIFQPSTVAVQTRTATRIVAAPRSSYRLAK